MSYHNYVNWAINLQNEFATMSIKDQIIVFALAVAITVLALTLTYWAVKGSLYLTYYSVKLSLYLTYYSVVLSLLIPYGIIKLLIEPLRRMGQQSKLHYVQSVPESPENKRHCSECGKEFTSAMEESIHNNGNCFCENCGVKAEIRA
jgi:hypothetical protein